MIRSAALIGLLGFGGLLAGSACDSAVPPPPPNTLTTPRPGATPSATPAPGFSKEATNPDPNFDMGYTVLITASGFHPQNLVAPCCAAVTWRNQTSSPVTVVFDHVVGGSGQPVPPGGVYVFVPQNIESITYHSGQDPSMTGDVQINQLAE